MSQHTVGPWTVFSDNGIAVSVMPAGRPGDICTLSTDVHSVERNANARMIAAAPDLYACMMKTLSSLNSKQTDLDLVAKRISNVLDKYFPAPIQAGSIRVLVCGGRDFDDRALADRILDTHVPQGAVIIHGNARGADSLADEWATDVGLTVIACPADWNKDGKAAGPIRNSQMLAMMNPERDFVIAFPGGAGTADMVKKAKSKKFKVIEVKE